MARISKRAKVAGFCLVGGSVLLCLVLHFAFWYSRGRHVTREQFAKVAVGMTFRQVEEIFGAPPGNYVHGRLHPFILAVPPWGNPPLPKELPKIWLSDEGQFDIFFGPDGRVAMIAPPLEVRVIAETRWEWMKRQVAEAWGRLKP